MLWGGGEDIASIGANVNRRSPPTQKLNDFSRSLIALEPEGTLTQAQEPGRIYRLGFVIPSPRQAPLRGGAGRTRTSNQTVISETRVNQGSPH